MKRLSFILICLSSVPTLVQASTFNSCLEQTKSIAYAIGSVIKYCYFPDYNAPTSPEKFLNAHLTKEWEQRDKFDPSTYWNREQLMHWAQTAHKQGEAPLKNNFKKKNVRLLKRSSASLEATEEDCLISALEFYNESGAQ